MRRNEKACGPPRGCRSRGRTPWSAGTASRESLQPVTDGVGDGRSLAPIVPPRVYLRALQQVFTHCVLPVEGIVRLMPVTNRHAPDCRPGSREGARGRSGSSSTMARTIRAATCSGARRAAAATGRRSGGPRVRSRCASDGCRVPGSVVAGVPRPRPCRSRSARPWSRCTRPSPSSAWSATTALMLARNPPAGSSACGGSGDPDRRDQVDQEQPVEHVVVKVGDITERDDARSEDDAGQTAWRRARG